MVSRGTKISRAICCVPAALIGLVLAALPTSTIAATGFAGEFLAVGAGARAMALGNAYVALVDDATAGYWNSAALSDVQENTAYLMHADRFSGLLNQDFVAVALPGFSLLHGFSASLLRLGVEDIEFTTLQDPSAALGPDNRPVVSSTETSADYALYLSGGRRLGERLDIGVSLKGIYRTVSSFSAYGFGADVGLRYRLATGITLAANLRDITTTPIIWNTDTTDRIRPSVNLGVAVTHTVGGGRTSLAIGSRAGGNAKDQSGAELINVGIEYEYQRLALRAGLEDDRQAFGIGLRPHDRLQLDVAFLQHDELEDSYLFSASLEF